MIVNFIPMLMLVNVLLSSSYPHILFAAIKIYHEHLLNPYVKMIFSCWQIITQYTMLSFLYNYLLVRRMLKSSN